MGKFASSWALMKASWNILKLDKEMLLFPVFSLFASLLVIISFALPIFFLEGGKIFDDIVSSESEILKFIVLYLFYFCNYFVIIFFNSAIISCATIRMNGGDPTVTDGLRSAFERLPLIAGWAVVASSVGMILRMIEERLEIVGRIVAGLLGLAWTVTSFLVIPILVVEKKDPMTALKESTLLLKKTWGQQLITNFSFGLIFFLLGIPAFIIIIFGIVAGNTATIITSIVIAVIYLILLALIQSTLQGIFQAALFKYARTGEIPQGFDESLLKNSIRVK